MGSTGQARDRRCRAGAWHDFGEKPVAAGTLDEIRPDNLIEAVVVALDEELRPDLPNELDWRVLLEDDDQVDGSKRGQHRRALGFVLDRTSRAFEPRCRCIAVETDDEPIARRLGLPEQSHMAGMQQIKAAVGKADFEPMAAPS